MGSAENYKNEIKLVKNRLVNTSLIVATIAGFPLLVISIIRSIEYNQIYFALTNGIVYLIIFFITLFRTKIQYNFRAFFVVFMLLVLATSDFYNVGVLSMGYIWLATASVFSFLYFDLKKSLITTIVSIAIIVVMRVLQIYDIEGASIDLNVYAKSPFVIALRLMSFVLASLIIVFSIRHIANSLNSSIVKLEKQKKNLIDSALLMRKEIKQRKEMEEVALQSEKKFRNIFETSSDPIVIVGMDRSILDYNSAFLSLSEVDGVELKGSDFFKLIPNGYEDFFGKYSSDVMDIPPRFELKYKSDVSGLVRYLDVKTNIIKLEDENVLLAVFRDYTEKIKNERLVYSAAIEAEEKERFRMSKELHDGLGPLLSTLKMYFEAQKRRPDDEEIPKRIKNILDESVKSVKDISNNLSPYILQTLGVVKALEVFIEKILYTQKLEIRFNYNFEDKFKEKVEITLYRLITELLNNTMKYAKANKIEIELDLSGSLLKIEYLDDGIGFNSEIENSAKNGIGLFNMKSRIEKMGGVFDINTSVGNGFKLNASLFIDDLN